MLTNAQKQQVMDFLGYGTPERASVVFVGEKEYTPAGTQLDNLAIRSAAFSHPWEDKNLALQKLAAGFTQRGNAVAATHFAGAATPGRNFAWNGAAPSSVKVWTWAAMVAKALRDGTPCVPSGPWFSSWMPEYQALGTFKGDTVLSELFPLPQKSVQDWPDDYRRLFGHSDAAAYFDGVFPRGQPSPRRALLERELLDKLPRGAIVICYGRGGRGAEFWARYDELLAPVPSSLSGSSATWHAVIPNRVEVGVSRRGHLIARVGFPYNRPPNAVTHLEVPELVNALLQLRATR